MMKDTDRQALVANAEGMLARLRAVDNGRLVHKAANLANVLLNDVHHLRKALTMITAPDSDAETRIRCRAIAERIEARLPKAVLDSAAFLADNGL